MTKQISSYVGTASHLFWLVTGREHPKMNIAEQLAPSNIGKMFNWDRVDSETKAEEELEDERNVEESEEIELTK